ncbi:MAG TPA: MFS transporter [Dehalococcoidia bacterium]|nr:MFS transporter [Dehalococcoidia bacterium]
MTIADAPTGGEPRHRSLLLANAHFRWLWLAHLVSMFGDGLYTVALPWLVFKHTGSGVATAITLAAGAIPYILVSPIAGVCVDRWSRRRTMIGADLLRALTLLAFPLVLLAGFNLGVTIALAIVLPAIGRFFVPAQRASTPQLVDADALVGANALMEGAGQAAYIAGPAVGGVLIALVGAVSLLFIDGATFVASALLIGLIAFPHQATRPGARPGFRASLAEGLRTTWHTPALRTLSLLVAFVVCFFATVPALLPLWVGRGRPAAYGVLTACFFVGSLLASLWLSRWGRTIPRGTLVVAGVFGMTAGAVAFAASYSTAAAAVALAVFGAGLSCYNVGVLTLLQRLSPPQVMGRVLAFNDTFAWSLRPFAVVAAGVLADAAGVHAALVIVSIGLLGCGVAALAARPLHEAAPMAAQQEAASAA